MDLRWLRSMAVAVCLCLLMSACGLGAGDDGVDKDRRALALLKERLSVVLPDLDAVRDPVDAVAQKPARFSSCHVDNSGDLHQPEVHREWTLHGSARVADVFEVTSGGRAAGEAIASQLVRQGWTGSAELDQDAATDLSRSFEDYEVHLGIQAFNDVVNVWATTTPRRVCQGPS